MLCYFKMRIDLSCSRHYAHLTSSESLTLRISHQHVMWKCGASVRSSHYSRVECDSQFGRADDKIPVPATLNRL